MRGSEGVLGLHEQDAGLSQLNQRPYSGPESFLRRVDRPLSGLLLGLRRRELLLCRPVVLANPPDFHAYRLTHFLERDLLSEQPKLRPVRSIACRATFKKRDRESEADHTAALIL